MGGFSGQRLEGAVLLYEQQAAYILDNANKSFGEEGRVQITTPTLDVRTKEYSADDVVAGIGLFAQHDAEVVKGIEISFKARPEGGGFIVSFSRKDLEKACGREIRDVNLGGNA